MQFLIWKKFHKADADNLYKIDVEKYFLIVINSAQYRQASTWCFSSVDEIPV
jgi:hypothetical protein